MINIRGCTEGDRITYLKAKMDAFVGDKYFFDIPNDTLLNEKRKYELDFNNNFKDTYMVISEGEAVGTFAVYKYEDGVMFSPVSIIKEFETDDIKSFVIKYVKSSNRNTIYSIIYKSDLDIYRENGFEVIGKNDIQYKLKINNN